MKIKKNCSTKFKITYFTIPAPNNKYFHIKQAAPDQYMTNLCLSNSKESVFFCTPSQYKTLPQQNLLLPSPGLYVSPQPNHHPIILSGQKQVRGTEIIHMCVTHTHAHSSLTPTLL